jgi:hypothetical protein
MARHDTKPNDESDDEDDGTDLEDAVLDDIIAQFADPVQNRIVQQEAVAIVTSYFETEGWAVAPSETDHPGYDLLCTKDAKELHIGVKGTSGSLLRCIMTDQELEFASEDDNYLLCLVTGAGTDDPALSVFDGDELLDDFRYRPTQWAFQHKDEAEVE